jgi:hypothetical protein
MPVKLVWTPQRDTLLKRMRSERAAWDTIAAALGISRNAAMERARRVGARLPPPDAAPPPEDPNRPPLPAGHDASWGAIVAGTLLEGAAFRPAPPPFRRPAAAPDADADLRAAA